MTNYEEMEISNANDMLPALVHQFDRALSLEQMFNRK